MALNGYDIAGVNGTGIITTALTGSFVIVKASEGQSFTDPLHDSFVAKAHAAGKLVGHYHYGRPDTKDTSDAVKEADHFIASAKAKTGDTMWLDFEKSETADQRTAWPEWVVAFCARVWSVTGASCGVYLNDWFANRVLENATAAQAATIRALPLWKAGNNNVYVSDPTVGAGNIHGWPVLTCWQWTDKQGSLGIDRDIFYGDASTWRALGVGAPDTKEDPMPTADEVASAVLGAQLGRATIETGAPLTVAIALDRIYNRPPDVPVDVDALASALVAKLPADKPVTTEQLTDALRTVLGSVDNQPAV